MKNDFPIINRGNGFGILITGEGLENVFEQGTIFTLENDGPNGETSTFEFVQWDQDSNRGMWFKPADKWTKDYYLKQEEGNEGSMYDPETGWFWFDHDGFIDGPFIATTVDGKVMNYDPKCDDDP